MLCKWPQAGVVDNDAAVDGDNLEMVSGLRDVVLAGEATPGLRPASWSPAR